MLRVVGAGLGRNGTTSLKTALEQLLGEPCYHMHEVRERPRDPDAWGDAFEGLLPDWRTFFEGYGAVVDWPAAPFWQDISDAFPQSVVLLSSRDPDDWWKSVSSTIFPRMAGKYFVPEAPDDGWTRMGRGMMRRFSPGWQDEEMAKAAYLAYNDHVREAAPPDRFVDWRPGDGWVPICSALGISAPDEPFPHQNTTADFRARAGLDSE